MRYFRFKAVFIAICVSALMFSACARVDSQTSQGKAADFTLETSGGGAVTLSSELASGRKAVLVFFATWCPSCAEEVPHVNAFYAANKGKVLVFGIDIRESKAKVAAFMEKKGADYPVLLDRTGEVAGLYGVRGIPTIVVLDSDRNILYRGHSMDEMSRKVRF